MFDHAPGGCKKIYWLRIVLAQFSPAKLLYSLLRPAKLSLREKTFNSVEPASVGSL